MLESTAFNVLAKFRLVKKEEEPVASIERPKSIRKPVLSRKLLLSPISEQNVEATKTPPPAAEEVAPQMRTYRSSLGEPIGPSRVKSHSMLSWTAAETVRGPSRSVSASLIVLEEEEERQRLLSAMTAARRERRTSSLKKASIVSIQVAKTQVNLQPVKDGNEEEEEEAKYEDFDDDDSFYGVGLFKPKRPLERFSSPFIKLQLERLYRSPFHRPIFGVSGPRELSFCLEDAYCPVTEILMSMSIKYKSTDVIVCSPMRTGQTPVLRAVASLLRNDTAPFRSDQYLVEHVGFVGTRLPHLPSKEVLKGRRLFKTHMNLRCFVRAEAPQPPQSAPKSEFEENNKCSLQGKKELTCTLSLKQVIIPLRDPCRVLESWFRHIFSVYESVEGHSFPYGQADFRSFCPGAFNPAHYQEGEDYEKSIATALSVAHLPNVCLIFYEDLVTRPQIVIAKLAKFLGAKCDKKGFDKIVNALKEDYKAEGLKLEPVFSDDFIEWRERKWCDFVMYRQASFGLKMKPTDLPQVQTKGLMSYYELYERLSDGRMYPMEKFISSRTLNQTEKVEFKYRPRATSI